jgi:ABC-type transport system involved in multi-copper enzyme maturation permease subunit
MTCLPLIERELRVALRKQRPTQGRLKVAALATAGSILFLLFGAVTNDRSVGRGLEELLCVACLSFVLRAPRLTAGGLAEERRNQTLGLLFLSGLGAGEVFVSKFLSSALIAFTNLLAIFPMLALPFLIGGISYDLFVAIICALPVLMLFALAVSLLASVLTREDGAAVVVANVLGALLCLLAPAISLAHSQFSTLARPSMWWLRLSPAYGPYLVWRGFNSGFGPVEQREFWQNLSVTLAWSALALGVAAFALNRLWRELETEERTGGWRERWRQFMHGDLQSRQRLGRLWLNLNPFVWLAGRNRQPAMLGWLVVGGIVLIWLLCWAVWAGQWPSVPNFFITAMLLNMVFSWLTLHTAAQELGRARRDGAYELLLTTPLDPSDIVWGELQALRRHFRVLSIFVLTVNVLMMLGGLAARSWNTGALVVYLCVWLFLLAWTWLLGHQWSRALPVMWASLNSGRPEHAVWRAGFNTGAGPKWWYWIWIWNIYNLLQFWNKGFQRFPTGSRIEVVFALSITGLFLIGYLVSRLGMHRGKVHDFKWDPQAKVWLPIWSIDAKGSERQRTCARRLISEFREIVREPVPDPSDPRFKKWNVLERFPWGWELVQHQLLERLGRKSVDADQLWKSDQSN